MTTFPGSCAYLLLTPFRVIESAVASDLSNHHEASTHHPIAITLHQVLNTLKPTMAQVVVDTG
jgi:hypothetical protein